MNLKTVLMAVLLGLISVIPAFAITYYVDGSVPNDYGSGSQASPKKYIKSGIALMSGGDTLIIKDGVYTGSNNLCTNNDWEWVNGIPDGTPSQYTTIKAENDFGVIIDGQGVHCPWALAQVSYCQTEGIIFRNSGGSGFGQCMVWYSCDHIKVLRCAGYETSGDTDIFSFRYSQYCLYEDCFAWGRGRYLFSFYEKPDGETYAYHIARRCVARWDYDPTGRPKSAFSIYWAHGSVVQNCIVIDSSNPTGGNPVGLYSPNGVNNVTFDSSIVLNHRGTGGYIESGPANPTYRNCAFWSIADDGIQMYTSPTNATVTNCLLGNISGQRGLRIAGGNATVKNNIFYGVLGDGAIFQLDVLLPDDYNVFYNNSNNFYQDTPGTHDYCSQNSNAFNPLTNGLFYITRVESGSTLKTAGESGARVGVEILKKLGVSGTLYGETGWNTLTSDNLWPFPNEDTIRTQMRAYNLHGVDGTRGFCATGQTLTKYIWEYLGNSMPLETPTNLNAITLTSSSILLGWEDNSIFEEGFKIERKKGIFGRYAQINTAGKNTFIYRDAGLDSGTTYYYRVRTYNGSNNSNYSKEASARTNQ
jgi:hypothetical protein